MVLEQFKKLEKNMNTPKIAIIGLGYVGLPLARLFATQYPVIGFDINKNRIKELQSGNDSTLEVSNEVLQEVLVQSSEISEKGLYCTDQLDAIADCSYYIVTVPTPPVDKTNRPPILTPPYTKLVKPWARYLKKGGMWSSTNLPYILESPKKNVFLYWKK